tara:strand:- start:1434 stop:1652 length:219 start_codon:yes stop_codon:yes gene_type:complete
MTSTNLQYNAQTGSLHSLSRCAFSFSLSQAQPPDPGYPRLQKAFISDTDDRKKEKNYYLWREGEELAKQIMS